MKTLIAIMMFFSMAFSGLAQQAEYKINFRKDFGYSSGSEVRGKFTISVVGDLANASQVSYRIDGNEIALVTESPFKYSFQTGDYSIGWHDLSALITFKDGATAETPARRFEFVTQDREFEVVQKIIVPLGGGVLLITLLGIGSQVLMLRGKNQLAPGTARNYGFLGGTICKRCGRPYSIHIWSMSLGVGRLDRCDFCGHTAIVNRRSLDELRAAEAREKETFSESSGAIRAGQEQLSEEELLRKQLDDSKYLK